MNCPDDELLLELTEGPASEAVRAHVEHCERCRAEVARYRALRDRWGTLGLVSALRDGSPWSGIPCRLGPYRIGRVLLRDPPVLVLRGLHGRLHDDVDVLWVKDPTLAPRIRAEWRASGRDFGIDGLLGFDARADELWFVVPRGTGVASLPSLRRLLSEWPQG